MNKFSQPDRIISHVLKELTIISVVWLSAFLLRDWLSSMIEKLCPITGSVQNESWIVQIVMIAIVALLYVAVWPRIQTSRSLFPSRLKLFLIALAFYLMFRFAGRFDYYHAPGIRLGYIDFCIILSLGIELILFVSRSSKKDSGLITTSSVTPFVYDAPAKKDGLNRGGQAKLLVEKIVATLSGEELETSFCVLLNERYGAGKTSFFHLVKEEADKVNMPCIEFRPWLSDSPSAMMQDLLMLLESKLRYPAPDLANAVNSYARVISGMQIGILEVAFNSDLKPSSISDRRNKLAKAMSESKRPFLVLIDDVDRLDSQELVELLRLIRNTVDFPYLCYVLAADKESLSDTLKEAKIKDTDLYMRKFFNLELTFPPDDDGLMGIFENKLAETLRAFDYKPELIRDSIDAIWRVESIRDVFVTPRDINRYINLVSYVLDLMRGGDLLKEVYVIDLLYITLVQLISPEWYKVLKDRNDKILSYRIETGRFSVRGNKLPAFYTQSQVAAFEDLVNSEPKALESEKNASPTLAEIMSDVRPNPFNALKSIIYILFAVDTDTKTPERICYKSEYFKYFAGHYKSEEYSSAEAFSFIEAPMNAFSEEVSSIKTSVRAESLLHKMLLYLSEDLIHDRVDYLQKLMLIAEKLYSYSPRVTLDTQYKNSTEKFIVSNLFLSWDNPVEDLSEALNSESSRLVKFISEDGRYAHLALILKTLNPRDGLHFIYSDDMPVQLREMLINRFLQDLGRQPFSKDLINDIPYLREMYRVYWEDNFRSFVQKSPDPLSWVYRLITVNREGKIVWDESFINAVTESAINLKTYAMQDLGITVPGEISEDMGSIIVGNDQARLTEADHPFVKAAMDWHRDQAKRQYPNNY